MPIRFYLHSKQSRAGTCPLYCCYTFKGSGDWRFSTGYSIEPKHWNKAKQIVKASHPHADLYNDRIITPLRRELETLALEIQAYPNPQEPSAGRMKLAYQKRNAKNDFWTKWDEFCAMKKASSKKKTDKPYAYLTPYLKRMEEKHGALTFDSFTLTFFEEFLGLLKSDYPNPNTYGKRAQSLTTFLRHAHKDQWTTNDRYQFFKTTRGKGKHISLTEDELSILERMELVPHLERQRDIFLFQCRLGLRISDLKKLKPSDIQDGRLSFKAKKGELTNLNLLQIHVPKKALIIWEKYGGNLPFISEDKYRKYLKEACKQAGFTELVDTSKGRMPKWQAVSTHTARRTCATNLFRRGVHIVKIQHLLGHAKSSTTEEYIRASMEDFQDVLLVGNSEIEGSK